MNAHVQDWITMPDVTRPVGIAKAKAGRPVCNRRGPVVETSAPDEFFSKGAERILAQGYCAAASLVPEPTDEQLKLANSSVTMFRIPFLVSLLNHARRNDPRFTVPGLKACLRWSVQPKR